ncbi:DUF2059 domain-containing protein [Phenylobacterium sp.]|jgi:uncharacterized protein|uniref:DUF2059 domain-containing protein n=1 Tax=Phenylobacterium sp. TaxID=1871053 RepID=UPI0011FFA1B9|nr:DUF2059 domain-containing protein [Phenylobacterium sp.]THD65400.1 MAG: DUF2059 domain-containing protein [Phenylobacterium sp.]
MLSIRRAIACLAAATAIVAATPAFCADPAPSPHSLELANKLFTDMHMDQMMDGMMRQMTPMMMEQARKANPNLTADQAQAVTEAVTESMQGLMRKLQARMIPLYASTFTEKELQDVVNFYDGPSGQAMLAKMPVLMSKLGPTMAELTPELTADIQQRLCSKIDCSKMNAPPRPKT